MQNRTYGLITNLEVCSGDSLLGMDLYSQYDSVWNWDNPAKALVMTKRSDLSDEDLSESSIEIYIDPT